MNKLLCSYTWSQNLIIYLRKASVLAIQFITNLMKIFYCFLYPRQHCRYSFSFLVTGKTFKNNTKHQWNSNIPTRWRRKSLKCRNKTLWKYILAHDMRGKAMLCYSSTFQFNNTYDENCKKFYGMFSYPLKPNFKKRNFIYNSATYFFSHEYDLFLLLLFYYFSEVIMAIRKGIYG